MANRTFGTGKFGSGTFGGGSPGAGEIEFRLSAPGAGAGNAAASTPAGSLGGYVATNRLVNDVDGNLFARITEAQAAVGRTVYRCLFVYNGSADGWVPTAWIVAQGEGGARVELGLDASTGESIINHSAAQAIIIADELTAPAGVAFSAPYTAGAALAVGGIGSGNVRPLWFKMIVPADPEARDPDWVIVRLDDGAGVAREITLRWVIEPSPNRITLALTSSPVSYAFRYEKRSRANGYQADISGAISAGSITLDNDRDIVRLGSFTFEADQVASAGNLISFDPLSDHLACFMDLRVDGSYVQAFQLGLFAMNLAPKRMIDPAMTLETWAAADLALHLVEATTTAPYTVAAGVNYLTGAGAVAAILDAHSLAHALPSTALTLPIDMTWGVGVPWLRVVNDLLRGAGFYPLWFDATGVGRTRELDELSERSPDVDYTGEAMVLSADITEERETARFANQIVAVVDDPSRGVLASVRTNADPDSPTSTVRLGRTITRTIAGDRAADQATLDLLATRELQLAGSLYRKATITTSFDPRREAREVYSIEVEGAYERANWWVRNWSLPLVTGAQMKHAIAETQKVTAS